MKRNNHNGQELIYIHMNEEKQYVLSSGIVFSEFVAALQDRINHVLLLKHHFDDGDFNMHSLLEFVPKERLMKLAKDDVYSYGDFCWIDFEEEECLDELAGQELAELLYLSHMKDDLKPPFYHVLRNRFAYLAHDDGWWNRIYYRQTLDFYRMLGEIIASKTSETKVDKNLFGMRRKRVLPAVGAELLLNMKKMMKEGILISIHDGVKNRATLEIPIWLLGDFDHMDDMYEEYQTIVKKKPDAKLIFDKKSQEWKIYSH